MKEIEKKINSNNIRAKPEAKNNHNYKPHLYNNLAYRQLANNSNNPLNNKTLPNKIIHTSTFNGSHYPSSVQSGEKFGISNSTTSNITENNLNSTRSKLSNCNIDINHKKTNSISCKDFSTLKIRKDMNGNIIKKGSKKHHVFFNDTVKTNKKPLVDIIEVESYKLENVNEDLMLNLNINEFDEAQSNTCFIF